MSEHYPKEWSKAEYLMATAYDLDNRECDHTRYDGRSSLTNIRWSEEGFIARCDICGEIVEQ